MSKLETGPMSFPAEAACMPKRTTTTRHRRTKIVATLGPASSTEETITHLFDMGVDVFRLNFSHGAHADHAARIRIIRQIEAKSGRPIGILADVQGPKLRVGRFSGGQVHLQNRQKFTLDLSPVPGDITRVQLPHPEIISVAEIGTSLLLDDGKLRLQVVKARADSLECEVLVGGVLSDRKGVNVPDILLPIPALTKKDRDDLEFSLQQGVDNIGLSFVQRPEDVAEARALVAGRAWILSKIEKPMALQNLDEIIALSDVVMVARGDLGVELPPEDVPLVQKEIIRCARLHGKPVIVATQMLESMINAPTPTRAEASDVATAVFDGADAVMLSAETAAGQFPVEAVNMMDRIVARVERDRIWRQAIEANRPAPQGSLSGAITAAAGQLARTIGAKAITAFTHSGSTALTMARERPDCPVIGLTPDRDIARRLAVVWGTHAVTTRKTRSMTETVNLAAEIAHEEGFAAPGESVIVTAGVPFGRPGTTNALRVITVGSGDKPRTQL